MSNESCKIEHCSCMLSSEISSINQQYVTVYIATCTIYFTFYFSAEQVRNKLSPLNLFCDLYEEDEVTNEPMLLPVAKIRNIKI